MKRVLTLACGIFLFLWLPIRSVAADAPQFDVTILSSRPDMVSGGDALVQVAVPTPISLGKPMIKLNGEKITSSFHPDPTAHVLIGVVTGLKLGQNFLEVFADAKESHPAQQLALKNYPISGPIFSGAQEKPFICQTQDFKLPDGSTLGPALDENCSVKTVVSYVYKSTETLAASAPPGALNLKPLPSLTALPPDVAWTTTTTGEKVRYVVRVETGTINRAIYQIAVLHDPTTGPATPLSPPKAWNRRLLYSFGGGCPGGWLRQGMTLGFGSLPGSVSAIVSDATVGKGYAEVGATLNVAGNNCNDVISAETMMMVKEHFTKTYGKPLFTFSRGSLGGSYQQNQITDNYPGLLNGIIVSATFSDVQELTQRLTDSRLLTVYYAKIGAALTDEQKRAIAGVGELQNVAAGTTIAGRINPIEYCPQELSRQKRYDRLTNPSGVRCDIYDHNINLYGRDPVTGFARRPIDNTGVQYGLAALNGGTISTRQFLDLNENIGGYDVDGRVVASRSLADLLALRAAYQNGLITNGGNGLAKVPIIDVRDYRDQLPDGNEHLKYHSFAYRERLLKANGTFDNEVLLVSDMNHARQIQEYAVAKMDEWLTNLVKHASDGPILDNIVRSKPADLVDSCWTDTGQRIVEPQTLIEGQCNTLYPASPGPRVMAGGPLANNVLKCQLKPIDFNDYKVTFSDQEKSRLSAIFPGGVCDWNKPGVEQQSPTGTWLMH